MGSEVNSEHVPSIDRNSLSPSIDDGNVAKASVVTVAVVVIRKDYMR